MTVPVDNAPYSQYIGDGVTEFFPYGFALAYDSNVDVYVDEIPTSAVRDELGVTISPAPASGAVIELYRQTPLTQVIDWTAQDFFNSDWTEDAMDKLIILKQEAEYYLASANITSQPFLENVTILCNVGTDAILPIWNVNTAGVFAGFSGETIPDAGATVAKPENFVYFQWGPPAIQQVLTSTPYPIQDIEEVQVGADLTSGYMEDVETDVVTAFFGGIEAITRSDVKIIYGPDTDEVTAFFGGIEAITRTDILVTYGPGLPDEVGFVGGIAAIERKQGKVETYAPDEEVQASADLSPTDCYMMDEP